MTRDLYGKKEKKELRKQLLKSQPTAQQADIITPDTAHCY